MKSSMQVKVIGSLIGSLLVLTLIIIAVFGVSLGSFSSESGERSAASFYAAERERLKDLVSVAYTTLQKFHDEAGNVEKLKELKLAELKKVLDAVHSQASAFYEANKDTLSRRQMEEAVKDLVGAARYDGDNYVWINDLHPTMIMHPAKPAMNGQDLSSYKDPKGNFLFNDMVAIVKKKDAGMTSYWWAKPGETEPKPKVSYVRLLPGLGWILGTGAWLEDIEAEMKAQALEQISKMRLEDGNYFWIHDMDLKMVMHPIQSKLDGQDLSGFKDPNGKKLFVEMNEVARAEGKGFVDYMWPKPGQDGQFPKSSYVMLFEPWGWVIGMGAYLDDINAAVAAEQDRFDSSVWKLLVVSAAASLVVSALLGALVLLFLRRSLIKPLKHLVRYSGDIARGDFREAPDTRRRDEIGELARSMAAIPETLGRVAGEVRRLVNEVRQGNLLERGRADGFAGEFAGLITGTNVLTDVLVERLDMVPTPVMAIDRDFNVLYLNKAGLAVADTTMERVRGTKCHDLFRTSDCKTSRCACARAMEERRQAKSETTAHPAGKDLEISYTATPILDEKGAVVGAIEVVVDQTDATRAQKRIREIAQRANLISEHLSSASAELSAQVEQVSQGAEIQRDRIGETATAMEQMNATVLEVARNASSASESSGKARAEADQGAAVVEEAVRAIGQVHQSAMQMQENMQALGRQAEAIGKVLNVITDIADQTNLLALNAAIEAARAGDAGRGFAVVADEVRKLAEKTMGATKEVGDAIQAIQNAARSNIGEMDQTAAVVLKATELANQSGEALRRIVELVSDNAGQVEGIATASEEQSSSSDQINHALEEVNRIVAETTEGMVQSNQAVHEMARMSVELRTLISELSGEEEAAAPQAGAARDKRGEKKPKPAAKAA
jgi:methyl-accepting chemotaxis protein